MKNGMFRWAAILALLSAVGPFAIDMYLPALPTIESDLAAGVSASQMTLTAYFIAFGVAQLFYGPYADHAGRKPSILIGMAIFAVGTVGCVFAPTIGWLIAARFVQGLGGAAVMVVPRAVIRDLYTGSQATRLMAMIMLIISVSPMLAPLAGSGLIALGGWRLIFWVLLAVSLAGVLITQFALPETLREDNRVPINLKSMVQGSGILFRDPAFMGLTFIGGFGMASFFVFLASASFVYVRQFGLSPTGFSVAFAINAIGFFAASQMAASFGERFGAVRVIYAAIIGFAFFTLVLLALTWSGYGTLYVIVGMLFCANACLGLVIPTTMVMALDHHGERAGLASSLGGTLQMLAGGAMIAAASPFFDGTALPMVAAIALCAVLALVLTVSVLGRVQQQAEQGSA